MTKTKTARKADLIRAAEDIIRVDCEIGPNPDDGEISSVLDDLCAEENVPKDVPEDDFLNLDELTDLEPRAERL